MIREGTHFADYQPVMEANGKNCPKGYTFFNLTPSEKCSHRFRLDVENNALVMLNTNKSHKTNEFCIEPNHKAKAKNEHFAEICVKRSETDER